MRGVRVDQQRLPRLDVLKALGDATRYALYSELAEAPGAMSTVELAEQLGLHPNTVRPQLERLREAGLVEVEIDARGEVGRPQHRYSIVEPPASAGSSELLAEVASRAGARSSDAYDVGHDQGAAAGAARPAARSSLDALVAELDRWGFEPCVAPSADGPVLVDFRHCPYGAAAETHPELVCAMHRGMVEGFVEAQGDAVVTDFSIATDQTPCRVAVAVVGEIAFSSRPLDSVLPGGTS